MFNFFANIFGYVLNWIYIVFKNYGLAIITFSVLIKIAMLPLTIQQQKTLKKNEKLQKEMQIIQLKNKNNPEKTQQEMMELYKREKINPMGGCLNLIIQMILIISMFMLVRSPITYMLKINDESIINEQIENMKQEGLSVSETYKEMSVIKYLKNKNLTENEMYINMDFLGLDLSKVPQENLSDITVYIIPVLYVISSIISIKLTPQPNQQEKQKEEEKEENKEASPEEMTAQMSKSMTWMMPILSVSIAIIAPLGLALYWLINNIIMIVERLLINKIIPNEEE